MSRSASVVWAVVLSLLVAGQPFMGDAGADAEPGEPSGGTGAQDRRADNATALDGEGPVQYVVGFDRASGRGAERYPRGSTFHGATVLDRNLAIEFVVVESDRVEEFERRARDDPTVRYVEEDPKRDLLLFQPSDPMWGDTRMYGPRQIGADSAWDLWRGSPDAAVCVVDTGVRYAHEDIAGVRWRGGVDLVDGDDDPWDEQGHGTHVAGIAAASIHNGKGIAGTANVSLYAVNVFESLGATHSDVAQGIVWCTDNAGPNVVINLSLGGSQGSTVLHDAVRYAKANGAIVVAAAGNSGCSDCVLFPAKYPEVIAVSCTTPSKASCTFSSKGPEVELAAPGLEVLSTCFEGDASYCVKSGTSMSTPFVAGALALAWSMHPCAAAAEVVESARALATDLGVAGKDNTFGFGLVDPKAVMKALPCHPVIVDASTGPGMGEITTSWHVTPAAGSDPITEFRLLRGEGIAGERSLVAVVAPTATSYLDADLGNGTRWNYQVLAVNGTGAVLEGSTVTASTFSAPSEPLAVSTAPGPARGEITIAWSAPAWDGGLPVASYRVYRQAVDEPDQLIAEVAGTLLTDTGLPDSGTYSYAVSALNLAGEGETSPRVEGRTLSVPRQPRDVTTAAGPARGEATITWRSPNIGHDGVVLSGGGVRDTGTLLTLAPALVEGPALVTYRSCYVADTNLRLAAVTTLIDDVAVDQFAFRSPYTGGGTCTASDPATFAERSFVVDTDPTNEVRFDYINGDWRLAIAAVSVRDPAIPPAHAYQIYRAVPGEDAVLVGTSATTTFTDAGLPDDVEHEYTVAAVNEIGEGPPSAPVLGSTPRMPGPPHEPTARAGPGAGEVKLTWMPPIDDGGLPATLYRIFRTDPDGGRSWINDTTNQVFVDQGLAEGTPYSYEVTAVNEVGEGPLSAKVTATTFARPGAPRSLAARPGDGVSEVALTWQPPSVDGGTPRTEYQVYRSTQPNRGFALRATLGPATHSFDDVGDLLTTYYYRVKAVNIVGAGPASAVDCAKPLPWHDLSTPLLDPCADVGPSASPGQEDPPAPEGDRPPSSA